MLYIIIIIVAYIRRQYTKNIKKNPVRRDPFHLILHPMYTLNMLLLYYVYAYAAKVVLFYLFIHFSVHILFILVYYCFNRFFLFSANTILYNMYIWTIDLLKYMYLYIYSSRHGDPSILCFYSRIYNIM